MRNKRQSKGWRRPSHSEHCSYAFVYVSFACAILSLVLLIPNTPCPDIQLVPHVGDKHNSFNNIFAIKVGEHHCKCVYNAMCHGVEQWINFPWP